MAEEIWKDVPNFEGIYQVSDRGNVKSLDRTSIGRDGKIYKHKGRILKKVPDNFGYLCVCLSKEGEHFGRKVHQVVWDVFGDKPRNGIELQVDHINNNKTDNRIENLQLLSNRENSTKGKFIKSKSSKYTGVYWNKKLKKWQAQIQINKKQVYLGLFTSQKKAHQVYRSYRKQKAPNTNVSGASSKTVYYEN